MKARAIVLVVAAALGCAACSNAKKVGSAINLKELSEKSEVLGKLSQQQKKGNSSGGFVGGGSGPQTPSAAQQNQQAAERQAQINAQKQAAAVAFAITASGYDPYYIRVFVGGVVQVTNRDRVARSVTADRGEFDSGLIPPGGTWEYDPRTPGKFNFHDSTRPYVVGTLEVIAQ